MLHVQTIEAGRAYVPGPHVGTEIRLPERPQSEPGLWQNGHARLGRRGWGVRASGAPDPDNSGDWVEAIPRTSVPGINN